MQISFIKRQYPSGRGRCLSLFCIRGGRLAEKQPIALILAGLLWAALPHRYRHVNFANPVVCILVFLSLFATWAGFHHWRNPALVEQLASIQSAIESRLLSIGDADPWHERIFASQANRLIEGMNEADRHQLERAFKEKNAAYPRAQWRFAFNPVNLKVMVDGTGYDFLSDELVFNRYRADHLYLFDSPAFGERGEFLPWELFRPIQYDQMPRPMAEFMIDLQIRRFGKYLKPAQWKKMGIAQWRKIPDPVRKIAAYRMAWRWAVAYAPPSIRPEEAARILASVGRVESLFDIEKVIHRNSDRGKEDLGFLQISEVMRQRLGRLPEFRDYEKDDYLTPWVSIRAGSYSLFSVFLKGAGGDILKAIGHYNAGKHGLAQRAEKYLNAVLNQYRRAFIDKHYSPTLRFLLTKADPRYFRGIQRDVLFKNQQLIHAARTP